MSDFYATMFDRYFIIDEKAEIKVVVFSHWLDMIIGANFSEKKLFKEWIQNTHFPRVKINTTREIAGQKYRVCKGLRLTAIGERAIEKE
jgi:hypothetical protein